MRLNTFVTVRIVIIALLLTAAGYIFWRYATPNAPPNGMEMAVLFIPSLLIAFGIEWLIARFRGA